MILLTNEDNPNALKLIVVAKMVQQSMDVRIVTPTEGFLNRLPILELSSGTKIFSTSAAMQLIAPSTEDDVSINTWLEWDVCRLQPAIVSLEGNISKTLEKSNLLSLLKHLNTTLEGKNYLIEDSLSLADISIWASIWSTVMVTDLEKEISREFANIRKWLNNIEILPIVQESLREFKLQRGLKAISSIQTASWFPINSASSELPSKKLLDASPTKENDIEAISEQEIQSIKNAWFSKSYVELKKQPHPILPKKGERNVLVTSALPYVNNVPHLGNIIGCVLSADIFSRYSRQRNYNTLYICGTDEYGTATEAKALEEKTTPQAICDKFFEIHNDIYRWFSIGFDCFGRTTTPEQTEVVQSVFLQIKSQGYIINEMVDQLLCETCDRFLADRFVEGVCPNCKYEDARGDQCDGCGHLVNATELINPRCKVCNKTPIVKKSEQFFLDLPKVQGKLEEWISTVGKGWSPVARTVTKPWLRDGLKPRCITRDLKWGIPIPIKGYEKKVFYVWFDAPLGYVSITKKYTKEYEQWWKPKDVDVQLYQFMAKDNVPFHAIMFPACLMAADSGFVLVKHIMATEYLNYEDTKFSKSRGIGIFGNDAKDTGIPADVWRFYLAYVRPESQDSNFNWVDLATKNNSELLNNLGNFINRALVFAEKSFDSTVPKMNLENDDLTLLVLIQRELTGYIIALEQTKLRDGLRHVLAISKHGNQYMQSQEPWVKIKGSDFDKERAGTVIGICCNVACLLSTLLGPFMPNTSREIRSQLGLDKNNYGYIPDIIVNMVPCGHKIGKPVPLFTKIEDQQIETLREKYAGKQVKETVVDKNTTPHVGDEDVATLEAKISTQGLLVRDLKAKEDKTVWQPQVQILLALKKKLADLTNCGNKSENIPKGKKTKSTSGKQNSTGKVKTSEKGKVDS